MDVGTWRMGGERITRFRASTRPRCKKKRRLRYTGPMASAILSVSVQSENERRCAEVDVASSSRP